MSLQIWDLPGLTTLLSQTHNLPRNNSEPTGLDFSHDTLRTDGKSLPA